MHVTSGTPLEILVYFINFIVGYDRVQVSIMTRLRWRSLWLPTKKTNCSGFACLCFARSRHPLARAGVCGSPRSYPLSRVRLSAVVGLLARVARSLALVYKPASVFRLSALPPLLRSVVSPFGRASSTRPFR